MTPESPPAGPRRRPGRRVLPVAVLVLLAPWVAEYLLGSHSVRDLPLLVFLVPLYGGGALLIRELARRTGRGWPAVLLLGLAYGVVEAGILDQSLFNPDFMGEDFRTAAWLPGPGVDGYHALVFVVGHAIWSIGAPIAVVESLVPDRARTPWLGIPGLLVAAGLYLLGGTISYLDHQSSQDFNAAPGRLVAAAAVAVALIGAAFAVPRRPAAPGATAPPLPIVVLLLAFVASRLLWIPENWLGVALSTALLALAIWQVTRWARNPLWSQRHRMALAAGALLTYAWNGFLLHPWRTVSPPAELLSDLAFLIATIALILGTIRRLPRPGRGTPAGPGPARHRSGSVEQRRES